MANEYGGGVFINCIGEEKTLLSLPGSDDAIVFVLLKLANLPTDDEIERYDTLSALLARCPECDFTNYGPRKTLADPPTLKVNKTVVPGRLEVTGAPALTYTAAGGATNNDIGKLVWGYRPTSTAPDSAIRPVLHYRCVLTTDGTTRRIDPNAQAGSLQLDARRNP